MNDNASPKPGWRERAFIVLQWLLPQHLLSRLMHSIARCEWPPLKRRLIAHVTHRYRIDLSEAVEPDADAYRSFNHLFTRALRPDARPFSDDPDDLLCPADGVISAIGDIHDGELIQAKGMAYTLEELLGGNAALAEPFRNGLFVTIYLSPRDYHRVHMPASGLLREMIHVPGRLFSVNEVTTRLLPRLFARNERVVNLFQSDFGPFALILVGAIFVSSIDTVWAGTVTPRRLGATHWRYREPALPPSLERGAEMGRFNMGSTVILLFPADSITWRDELQAGAAVHVGETLARRYIRRRGDES